MKNILIATYILIVLLISAFAKADNLSVSNVSFNPQRRLLTVSGTYYGVCFNKVRPSLEEVLPSKNGDTAIRLQLLQQGPCVAQYKKVPFKMAFDTRTLGLPEGQKVEIHIADLDTKTGPIEMQTEPAIDFDYAQLQSFTGVVTQLGEKNFVLTQDNNSILKLSGPLDLREYVGRLVSIRGFEMAYSVTPIQPVSDAPATANVARVMVVNIFDLDLN